MKNTMVLLPLLMLKCSKAVLPIITFANIKKSEKGENLSIIMKIAVILQTT
jgi:hypothetical protein